MARIGAAAKEFEAALIDSWWKAMQGSFAEEKSSGIGQPEALQDLSRQTMAAAVAEAGGLGIASMILDQLKLGNSVGTAGKPVPGDGRTPTEV